MQSSPAERLGNLDLSHAGTECLEPLDRVAHEVGELVDWLAELHQCLGALFVETLHPGGDRRSGQEEGVGGLDLGIADPGEVLPVQPAQGVEHPAADAVVDAAGIRQEEDRVSRGLKRNPLMLGRQESAPPQAAVEGLDVSRAACPVRRGEHDEVR